MGETYWRRCHQTIMIYLFPYTVNTNLLTLVYELSYTKYVVDSKEKGQHERAAKPVLLAFAFAGSWQSGRLQPPYKRSTAQPFAGSSPALPAMFDCPTGSGNYPQGISSGRSQRTGRSRSTVILTHSGPKGKGQNDVSFLFCRLCQGWEVRSKARTALSVQALRQALQRAAG